MSNSSNAARADEGATGEAPRMVDIGRRRLAFHAIGSGTPAVVLETGLGAESAEWTAVQNGLAAVTRVCRYDRANRGLSDPAPRPRNAEGMVRDLHELLHVTETPGPFILVGHSYGGLLVRLAAHLHRKHVVGLVLVDAMHEDQFEVFGPSFPPERPDDPPPLREVRAFWTEGWRKPDSTKEGIDFPTSIDQARAIGSLGDLPIHVLTAGTFLNQPLIPAPARPKLQARWEELQRSFLGLSSRATQSFVREHGHFLQREAPNRVIEAVQAMIRQVQAG